MTIKKKPIVVAIIGARSGSRSIPHKNIRQLAGKPLMAWIIGAAREASSVDRVILSTDSHEYAEIGRKYGAETPFMRPANLASDTASDIDYLTHAVDWLEQQEGYMPDIILRLPPTAPLCTANSIDACVELLNVDPDATSARTITPAPKHPYKLWTTDGDKLEPFIPKEMTGFDEPSNMPRQAFPPAFAHVDVIAIRRNTLMNDRLLTGTKTRFHAIDKLDAIDIDTEIDFIVAEILLKRRLRLA